jgi:hypothetical protein
LHIIEDILSKYYGNNSDIIDNLDLLMKEFKVHLSANIIYYLLIKRLPGLKPMLPPCVLKMKPVELYKIAVYHYGQEWENRDKIINQYFKIDSFNDELLIKLFELWPTPATIEIN